MGEILDEANRNLVAQALGNQHVSEVNSVMISGAVRGDGLIVVIITFETCCGVTNYEMPMANAVDMITGLQGAIAATKDIPNATRN